MGSDVRQPAVRAERPRVLDARGGRRDPPRGARDGASSLHARPSSSRHAGHGSRCSRATCSSFSRSSGCCSSGTRTSPYWQIAIAYVFIGIGVGLAGTPASHSLTGSVPVTRAGMASGTADLQRDLGGALMQSILGALLTAGYASAMADAVASSSQRLECDRGPAAEIVRERRERSPQQYPQYADAIIAGGEVVVPRRRPVGIHGRPRRGPRSARCSSSSCSRSSERGGAPARFVPRARTPPSPTR